MTMIKGIPPSSDQTTTENRTNKPDASSVPQEVAEQFSSLLHEKERPPSKDPAKPKSKTEQSSDKKDTASTSQTEQKKDAKQHSPTDKSKSSSHDDKDGMPQSLDAFDIAAMAAKGQPSPSGTVATQTAQPAAADVNQIVGEIADRILVSTPADNPAGGQEICIHLKESVLPNTEVRIYRHAGSLQIEFMTASKDSQMFIEQRQSDIQKVLDKRLAGERVQVSVQDSRQTRGGQEEGRSRQQYVYPDQDDDNI